MSGHTGMLVVAIYCVITQFHLPYHIYWVQRVLEHCDDPKTQQIMMDEVLQSVCLLATDQYGNYVVQVSAINIFLVVVDFLLIITFW